MMLGSGVPATYRAVAHTQPSCLGRSRPRRASVSLRSVTVCSASSAAVLVNERLPPLLDVSDEYEATHAFSAFANWVIPGRLMVGRYPYVEGSRCSSREQGEAQLKQLLEAGLTTFICLQDELPPQPEMRLGGVKGFLPYHAVANMMYGAMGPPLSEQEITGLRNRYLDKFLPSRRSKAAAGESASASAAAAGGDADDSAADAGASRPTSLQFGYCPIVDLSVPSQPLLLELLTDLEARLARGECVYVHCWGGRGRAGLVAACFLQHAYGISGEEALQRIGRAYDTRGDTGYRSPETEQQRQLVRDFAVSTRS